MVKLRKLLRWGLRLHFIVHVFEFAAALYDRAWLTMSIVAFFGLLNLMASFLLPGEHIHFHSRDSHHNEDI